MSFSTNERIFICGATGSGKTTLASKLYEEETTLCVFINTNFEHIPEGYSHAVVSNVDDIVNAMNEGYTKICLNPTSRKDISASDVVYVKRLLFNIGKSINEKRKKPKIVAHIFIDEVQDYSNKRQPNKEIDSIWKKGRRYGVIGVAMSQRPADVSHTILTQSKYHVIFKIGTYEYEYFSHYHIPIEEFEDWIASPYHFIVWDGYTIEKYKPIEI